MENYPLTKQTNKQKMGSWKNEMDVEQYSVIVILSKWPINDIFIIFIRLMSNHIAREPFKSLRKNV